MVVYRLIRSRCCGQRMETLATISKRNNKSKEILRVSKDLKLSLFTTEWQKVATGAANPRKLRDSGSVWLCLALWGDQITVAYSKHDLTKTRCSNLGVSEFIKLAMHRLREPTVPNAFANVRGEVKEGREINLSVRLNRSVAIVCLCCRSLGKDTSDLISSVFVHFVTFLLYVRLVSENRESKSSTSPRRRIATRRNWGWTVLETWERKLLKRRVGER